MATSRGSTRRWTPEKRGNCSTPTSALGFFSIRWLATIALCGHGDIYFGTGGGRVARVFRSKDRGRSWTATETPIASGNASSGIFSIACHDGAVVAVGGDYKDQGAAKRVAVYSADSGKTWHLAEQQPGGYRSAVNSDSHGTFVAVGPTGTDVSVDGGVHWKSLEVQNFNAASFAETEGWAAGAKGTIARLKTQHK